MIYLAILFLVFTQVKETINPLINCGFPVFSGHTESTSLPSSRSDLRGGPLRSLSSRLSLRSRRSSLSRRRSSRSLSSRRLASLQPEDSSAGPLLQPPSSLGHLKRSSRSPISLSVSLSPSLCLSLSPGPCRSRLDLDYLGLSLFPSPIHGLLMVSSLEVDPNSLLWLFLSLSIHLVWQMVSRDQVVNHHPVWKSDRHQPVLRSDRHPCFSKAPCHHLHRAWKICHHLHRAWRIYHHR